MYIIVGPIHDKFNKACNRQLLRFHYKQLIQQKNPAYYNDNKTKSSLTSCLKKLVGTTDRVTFSTNCFPG